MGVLTSFFSNSFIVVAFCSFLVVHAENIYDWSPSISLTDNHEVERGLCLDIAGFRASLQCDSALQLHTCKEAGADTQFQWLRSEPPDPSRDLHYGLIKVVNYNIDCDEIDDDSERNACVVYDNETSEILLAKCEEIFVPQLWVYFPATTEIQWLAVEGSCLAKTGPVRPAGPNKA